MNPSQVAPLPTHTRPTRPKSNVALCRLGRPTLIFGFLTNTEATSRGDNPEKHGDTEITQKDTIETTRTKQTNRTEYERHKK